MTVLKMGIAIIAVFLLAGCVISPATAAVKYSAGSPDFTAAITGTNEFVPGQEATLRVLVQNNGVNLFKQVNHGTIPQEDLPNTAKSVTIGLSSDTPLIAIKTDPQYIGVIPGNGGSAILAFTIKISLDATDRQYPLPLSIRYQYPKVLEQEAGDTYHFMYDTAGVTIPLSLRIKPGVKTEILDAVPENLTVGSEGYISLKIRNTGPENGTDAVVAITRNGQSPVIPIDSTVFIGDFPGNGTASCRFTVAVSDEAEEQTYPVDISVMYRNSEGSLVEASPVTIGIPVGSKPEFEIISSPPQVTAGSGALIEVRYRNTGSTTVYGAQARITAHDPVSVSDNVAFLGDIGPGESATARYEITVDGAAGPGDYSFDTRLRYRDALDSSHESDTVPLPVKVLPAARGVIVIAAGIIIIIAAGIAVFLYRRRIRIS